jgi:hypothetical protein
VALVAAPPPSAAFPYQDVAHVGSLVLGALAARATWREIGRTRPTAYLPSVGVAIGLVLTALLVQGLVALRIR